MSGAAFYIVWGGNIVDEKIKNTIVVAFEGCQMMINITTNQMYMGTANKKKDTMNESWRGHGGRTIPLFWGNLIKWMKTLK